MLPRGSILSREVRWMGQRLRPFLMLLAAQFLCITVSGALTLFDPLVVKWLIDIALPKRDLSLVVIGTLVFCAVYAASLGTSYLATFIGSLVTQKLVFRLRVSLMRRI